MLVAHDGSSAAAAALDAVIALLGRELTSLTLAQVVDFESATTVRGRETEGAAQEVLDRAVAQLVRPPMPVDTIILQGDPPAVLAQFAGEHGYDLIVVGESGPGGRLKRST